MCHTNIAFVLINCSSILFTQLVVSATDPLSDCVNVYIHGIYVQGNRKQWKANYSDIAAALVLVFLCSSVVFTLFLLLVHSPSRDLQLL